MSIRNTIEHICLNNTVRSVPNPNRNVVQADAKFIPPTYVYVTAHSRVTSIKNDEGKSVMALNIITECHDVVMHEKSEDTKGR